MAFVSVGKIADTFNFKSPRRVQYLVKLGMPREARGQYDLGRCVVWYIRYLQKELERRGGHPTAEEETGSLLEERRRLIKAQADQAELDLSRSRGELIPITYHEECLSTLFMALKQRILTFGRIAPQLEGENRTVIRAKLDEAAFGLLASLAAGENGHDILRDTPPGSTPKPPAGRS